MSNLVVILHDQISESISSLKDFNKDSDLVLLYESYAYANRTKHHKKKLVLLLAAMRHFAVELEQDGYKIKYVKMNSNDDKGSLEDTIKSLSYEYTRVVVTEPSEYFQLQELKKLEIFTSLDLRPDDRFLASHQDFKDWSNARSSLLMEYFYREMRVKYDILMTDGKPEGGKWNYDSENRKTAKSNLTVPPTSFIEPDSITKDVISLVEENFPEHFGDIEPFHFAVTRKGALDVLQNFLDERLPLFGDYQDAMVSGEPWMFHAHISFYLNCGLLLPLECIKAAESYYQKGLVPLNAAEGFIRQILGWREFIRGIYWLKMPEYKDLNFLEAKNKLPNFYWDAKTKMNCLSNCVKDTKKNAYAHHIQRLMVLGNFALIAGLSPQEVNEWFLIVYADAYEWVELPNVSGMILFADGGYLASKPYAAGGSYINKMSDYCKGCDYSVTQKNGSNACPFNYLYWDFLVRNRDKLAKNPRIAMMYRTYDRMSEDKKLAIESDSKDFLRKISSDSYV
ncbi:MAG: cryptochrome/photolyase family protein [Pseudomonadota bacterium]|nr:cryptochrome/photolyase family protein [Pseudomonadota bacterium]